MQGFSKPLAIACGIGVSISIGALGYLIVSRYSFNNRDSSWNWKVSSRYEVKEVHIPEDSIGLIIGRDGENIRRIQGASGTRIEFKDPVFGATERICVIRGTPDNVEYAKCLILQALADQPRIQQCVIFIPKRACGRIIGRGGETIRDIRKQCRADISIQKDDKQDGHTEILLRGTLEQIAMAKDLIREKVEEAEAFSEKISKKSDEKNLASSEEALGMHHAIEAASSARVSSETGETVELVPAGGDGFMGLLVSAVEDAGHFWVQVHGPNAIALEKLTDDMCAFYGDSENQQKYTLDKVTIDDLVAAKFMDEDRYYRCRVTGITENEYSPQESRLDLMFLDYGDSCSVKKNEAFCLAVHFQELQFQAVECCLAKVSPRDGHWSEDATDLFEELSKCARWQVVMGKIQGYTQLPAHPPLHPTPYRVPLLQLVDTSTEKDIDVADELVKRGFATYKENEASASAERGHALSSDR